jgi:hypothetical protein
MRKPTWAATIKLNANDSRPVTLIRSKEKQILLLNTCNKKVLQNMNQLWTNSISTGYGGELPQLKPPIKKDGWFLFFFAVDGYRHALRGILG